MPDAAAASTTGAERRLALCRCGGCGEHTLESGSRRNTGGARAPHTRTPRLLPLAWRPAEKQQLWGRCSCMLRALINIIVARGLQPIARRTGHTQPGRREQWRVRESAGLPVNDNVRTPESCSGVRESRTYVTNERCSTPQPTPRPLRWWARVEAADMSALTFKGWSCSTCGKVCVACSCLL